MALAVAVPSCAKEVIAHQQVEREATKILVLLGREGVVAEKIRAEESRELAFDVVVAKDLAPSSLEILERYNLPETHKPDTELLFKEGGMIPTNTQERAKREVGIAGDIVNSLRRVPGVVDASALVSIPEDNPLRDVNEAKPKPKASVLVAYLPALDNQPPIGVEDVQRFVQAGLPELKSAEVSVQLLPVKQRGRAGSATEVSGSEAAALALANGCEKETVLGIDVCKDGKKSLFNLLIAVSLIATCLCGLAIAAVLRALGYRKDLTRLTAQFAQLKK